MQDNVVETFNLSRAFDGTMVVYRLSLTIPRGHIFGLLGPNGAGKSTTIKMITGRIRPTSGSVTVFGLNPWHNRVQINQNMGYLPENPAFYADMDVLSYITFITRLHGYSRKESLSRGREVLNRLGLGRLESHKVGKLSQGQKQRLGFSSAIIHDPEFLILDEPTANLDPEGRVYVLNLIKSLKDEGKTILISSHILPEIERICDYIGIISNGNLLASGKTTSLTHNVFDDEFKIIVSDQERFVQQLEQWEFIEEYRIEDQIIIVRISPQDFSRLWREIPAFCTENDIELRTFSPLRDPLEKVFLSLVRPTPANTPIKEVEVNE